jgi:abortive infection bacteriophage resistance protein
MSTYNKPYLTFQEQLTLLKSRGLIVTDDKAALQYLRRLGYYRLSGYWYTCRKLVPLPTDQKQPIRPHRQDGFLAEARFKDAVELYVFDKNLRLLVLDAIERIEVAFRVDISYLMGKKDKFAYINPNLLHGNFTKKTNPRTGKSKHQDWLFKHDQLINRSKEDFTTHYKTKYGLPLPIWVAIELWDFGLLSTFYHGMTIKDKTEIATKYKVPDWQVMESWLRCVNYARNVVAHHNRLWNRNLIDQPKLAKKGVMSEFDPLIGNIQITSRVYVLLCILSHFMRQICPRSSWSKRLVNLIKSFPNTDHFDIEHMGFPEGWEDHRFWKGQ